MLSLTKLKSYLNITDSSKDTFLQSCINASVAEVEDICRRKLSYGSYTEYLNGNNKYEIHLRNYPVIEVTSITYFDGYETWDDLFFGGDTISDSSLIIPQTNTLKLLKGYSFYKGCKNIKITYTSGYDEDDSPEDIQSVLLEMASLKYMNSPLSGHSRLGKSSDNVNSATGESTNYQRPEWVTVLNKYRLLNP